jgi:hypothetical protein
LTGRSISGARPRRFDKRATVENASRAATALGYRMPAIKYPPAGLWEYATWILD